jgi:hypothetical protein
MADENTTAEDLIAEIREAASDFTAGEAEIFAQEARQEVAQYRQAALTFGFGEETRIRAVGLGQTFVVPEPYRSRAEVFLVFEVFVRFFIDPILVGASLPELLGEIDPEVERLEFVDSPFNSGRETGNPEPRILYLGETGELRAGASGLIEIATELGRALFGEAFRAGEFWETNE